ncbi:MAG: protocatechuate 3,4-dioxygenase subunit alpha [Acidobacteria bacterium SCN 69-37]|nr:MAG: protocatechuate 3,4-dioxygenase subunit alpha [Acidobacteria bacterium SCN 69-37]
MASGSQTVGPYLHIGLDTEPRHGVMVGPHTAGERMRLRLCVLDGAGQPVPDALVELWQADASGRYVETADHPNPDPGEAFRGWGRRATNRDGWTLFETIRPAPTTSADGRTQASHINVCLFARGMLRHIFTRVYFAGDPMLATDPVLALVPEARRGTLIADRVDDMWTLTIRIQGDGETVFFDL